MFSWPAFLAAALAIWLLQRGPAAETPIWVQKSCRAAMAFFLYCGFLYLLKWTTFWRVMPAIGFDRSKTEGFLILLSTLVWVIATLRILRPGTRVPARRVGGGAPENRWRPSNKTGLTLKNIAIFHYFFTRR